MKSKANNKVSVTVDPRDGKVKEFMEEYGGLASGGSKAIISYTYLPTRGLYGRPMQITLLKDNKEKIKEKLLGLPTI